MIEILIKKREWVRDGEVIHSCVCVKKDKKVVYHSKDSVHMNLGSNESPDFFKLTADNEFMLILESNQHTKQDEYIMIDLIEEISYGLGYFQDKESLDFIRRINSFSRKDITLYLKNKNVKGEKPKGDNFKPNLLEIMGINGWVKEQILPLVVASAKTT